MRGPFVCVAALGILAHASASAESSNHRRDDQREPAVSMSPDQYLPASGDVYPNSVTRIGATAAGSSERKALRRNMQASRRFHGGGYVAPLGYQYRHWSYGERLPPMYYAQDHRIGDFVRFGLSAPPSDLVWVRVGDDTLLIDRDTGEIVQVHYNFFY